MKILYLLKQDPDRTLREIMSEHQRSHDVTIIDIREMNDFATVIDEIEKCDTVISW